MTVLAFLLLAMSIGLAIALFLARRRVAELLSADRLAPEPVDDEAIGLAAQVQEAASVAPVGVVVLDESGDQVFENEAAKGYSAATPDDAVLGVRLRTFLGDAGLSADKLRQEVEVFSPVRRIVLMRSIPLIVGGRRAGTAIFIDDLTAASQVDSMRSDFIANASHELKTPLGALRLLSEALAATDDPAVQEDLSRRIQTESVRMTRIVEDILNLATIEGGHQDAEVVDLCSVVDSAVAQSAVLSETSGVAVDTECLPANVRGDRRQLTSAIANLVENAINYTAVKGGDLFPVEIRVDKAGQSARISIADHGIGVSERHQDRIFERFYRVDRGRSRDSGGTGLGLSIVRHVVENHHGTVTVDSVPGEGSVFHIELPIAEY